MNIPHYSIKKACISALVAAFLFAAVYAVAKIVSAKYNIIQVVFFRYLFALIAPFFYGINFEKVRSFRLEKDVIKQQVIRGFAGMVAALLFFQALTMMPVSDAISLSFSSSLFMCILSGPMLGEKVDISRWIAILVGFLGVLVIANPTGDVFNWGTILVLLCALLDAYVLLKGRFFSKVMPISIVVIYYNIFAALSAFTLLPFVWEMPTVIDFCCIAFIGLIGGVGQIFLTQAFKSAPGSIVAPIGYTNIIWTMVFAYVFLGDTPSFRTMIGSLIIIAAGIYIVRRASQKTTIVNQPINNEMPEFTQKLKKKNKNF